MKAHTDCSGGHDVLLRPVMVDELNYCIVRQLMLCFKFCCITTSDFHLQGKRVFPHLDF
jgi:hypothetical protein